MCIYYLVDGTSANIMELEVKEQHGAHSKVIPILWSHFFYFFFSFQRDICVEIRVNQDICTVFLF